MVMHTLAAAQLSPAGLTTQVGFIRPAHLKCPKSGKPDFGRSIILRKKLSAKKMDCRVKPGNDGERPQFKTIYMIHTNS
jgi:hypothetical protein